MEALRIWGGKPLHGAVQIHGAKNSVLPILAATVAVGGQCTIANCPEILDVQTAIEILQTLGCTVTAAQGEISVDARHLQTSRIDDRLMKRMRSSVLFLGALLARTGTCTFTAPGGCVLGERPINFHLNAMQQMGAQVEQRGETIVCRADSLHGATICLPMPSVGATENILLAAMGTQEPVTLCNAAMEPEIVDLANFLQTAGAKITGAGTQMIQIRGAKLHGCRYTVLPDRIETATYLAMTACAGGDVCLKNCAAAHLQPVLELYQNAGCQISVHNAQIQIAGSAQRAVSPIKTAPYPGFPTDVQALVMASMATASGISVFMETVFSDRYRHVPALRKMGAEIQVGKQVAVVRGVEQLHGATVEATDLRGGAAMVAAALGAKGLTQIHHLEHIARGYDSLVENLQQLGAEIQILT